MFSSFSSPCLVTTFEVFVCINSFLEVVLCRDEPLMYIFLIFLRIKLSILLTCSSPSCTKLRNVGH